MSSTRVSLSGLLPGLRRSSTAEADDWPFTSRPLPWLLAGFLAMLWLVPVAGVRLKVSSPVDPTLDRFAVAAIAAVWLYERMMGRSSERRSQPMLFKAALLVFVTVAVASVLLQAERISMLGELDLAQKQLAQLLAFVVLAFVVMTTLRPSELRAFSVLLVGLACVTALAVVYEKQTNYNVFYEQARSILRFVADVVPSPTEANPDPGKTPRATIVGPTEHGLAVATMFAIALPFAILGAQDAKTVARRWAFGLAAAIILAGALTTARKTAVLAPLAAILVLVAYRPQRMIKLAPAGVVLLAFVHVLSPGALGTVRQFNSGFFGTTTTAGRTSDYDAILPDVLTRPVIGRGYGTLNPALADTYRILDNEYLGQLFQVGFVGLLAYVGVIVAAMAVAHPRIRARDPVRSSSALAAAAGCFAFAVASALFDIMSFVQAPYMFVYVGAIATVAGTAILRRRPEAVAEPVAPIAPFPPFYASAGRR